MPTSPWFRLALAWVVFRAAAAPVLVLLHEVAHAGVALAVTNDDVTIVLGRGQVRRTARVGRLGLGLAGILRPFGLRGSTRWNGDRLSLGQTTSVFLAGPLVSLFLTVALATVTYASPAGTTLRLLLWMSAASSAWLTLLTLLPIRTPDAGWRTRSPSDALQLLRRIRARRQGDGPTVVDERTRV